jgi:hypothetical protein
METKGRLMNRNGNAILIAGSIYSACKYYEIFQSKSFRKCAIVTSFVSPKNKLQTETVSLDEDTEAFEKDEIYQKIDLFNNHLNQTVIVYDSTNQSHPQRMPISAMSTVRI